jgi:acetolactate synthase I/II/III large subunit
MVKVSDVIAEFLVKNNIDVVFGIIGSANSHIFDSLDKTNIKLVSVHHEQAAVMAMGAYYRSTGRLSAALVTAGGGSSNAFTGIVSNWADSIPGIIISGQEQTYYITEYENMRMYGIQGYDSVKTFNPQTKLSSRVTPDNVYDIFQKAFEITQTGRPGPVFLEVPFDTQSKLVKSKSIKPFTPKQTTLPKKTISHIIEKLNNSSRPVVIGGHGVKLSGSEDIFKRFITKHKLPTILTWSAIDLLPSNNANNFGKSGVHGQRSANFIVQNSDLLIVFGSRLSLLQTGYSRKDFAPNAYIIHIDIDPLETNKFGDFNVNENVNGILRELVSSTNIDTSSISPWIKFCKKQRSKYPLVMPEHKTDPLNSYTFIERLSELVPDNYTIVTDMGTALLSGFYNFKIKPKQKMFTSLGLGEMGYGLAAAVGSGFAGKKVLCLNCDGGMMMNLQELQTIKTHNLPVKIVIFNNDGYLMIKHTQKMLFGDSKTCVDSKSGVELPDYKKVAKAFNFSYYTESNLLDFLEDENQAFLEVFMDPNQSFIPKVKGMKMADNTIKAGLLEDMHPLLPLNEIKESMVTELNERLKESVR